MQRGRTLFVWAILLAMCGSACSRLWAQQPENYDVVVYGGNSAAVMAAVEAKRLGKSVIVLCPEKHLGGLSSGGLGFTDTGNKATIGGLSREFYHRVWKKYAEDATWKWQKRSEYGNKGQGTAAIDGQQRTMWIFEPHVAESVFEDLVRDYEIKVVRNQWLDRSPGGVTLDGRRIKQIRMDSGGLYAGQMFIDATYEGDLMAASGVPYTVGREANSQYGETWNGIQVGTLHHKHWFKAKIDPYVKVGEPASGLLPRISAEPPGEKGAADRRIQAYCYRMCLTQHPDNRLPFPKPLGYDAREYELLLRVFAAGWRETFEKFDPIPNLKTDTNNHGPFSTDNIGRNYDYPEAGYARRLEILDEHTRYQQGLMYFMANDPRMPEDVRQEGAKWGLAKDEFVDNGHWPYQIYVREARRMVGKYVMTEHDCLDTRQTPESIGMGSYTLDSHNVQRYVTPEGYVQNEGDIGVSAPRPYEISLGAVLPPAGSCENLVVPVCVSSTHIAFGSIRMEPVFMILAHSAAATASLAIDRQSSVQAVPYDVLRKLLLAEGQVLEMASGR
ncbi:MAG: FAD-dependent oxidoreductase [Pirellulaceae bacterium]|nr:FAD-dependent oxidoreductase [Pirellulaceae bacterium]